MGHISDYFALHPLFTVEEIRRACFRGKVAQTPLAALHRHEKTGRIRRLKRGLYQSRPLGIKGYPPPSPLLVASRLCRDAVLSHHSAFEALGTVHSAFGQLATYWTGSPRHEIQIKGVAYQPLMHPEALRKARQQEWGVETVTIEGLPIRTTSRERTLADSLQNLRWVGGWDEFCHCVDKFPYLDMNKLIEYADLIQSPALFGRLGFFLEANRERFHVDKKILQSLHQKRPKTSAPLLVGEKMRGKLNARWNVWVPGNITTDLRKLI